MSNDSSSQLILQVHSLHAFNHMSLVSWCIYCVFGFYPSLVLLYGVNILRQVYSVKVTISVVHVIGIAHCIDLSIHF